MLDDRWKLGRNNQCASSSGADLFSDSCNVGENTNSDTLPPSNHTYTPMQDGHRFGSTLSQQTGRV